MTEAYNNPLPEHDRWVQRIAGNRKLDALSRRQIGCILHSLPPNISAVAFYCTQNHFARYLANYPLNWIVSCWQKPSTCNDDACHNHSCRPQLPYGRAD